MVQIDTLFQIKTAKKTYPLRGTPGTKNALQIISHAAYVSDTKK